VHSIKSFGRLFSQLRGSFDETERGPDEELRLQFEAVAAMPPQDKELAKSMLEAIILKNQVTGAVRQLSTTVAAPVSTPKKTSSAKRHAATSR